MEIWPSDHRPILLSFVLEEAVRGSGRFYFDKRMIGKERIEEAVRNAWSGFGDPTSLIDRLAVCRRELSQWKRANNFNSRNRIPKLQEALEKEIARLQSSARSMSRLRTELAQAHKEEERFWRQRSREQWLKEGDMNTSYFHNVVKGKKIRNRVLMLKDSLNIEHFSEGAKGQIAVDFFRDLFMSSNPFDLVTLFTGFAARVTPEMNASLTKEFSADEIKRAAFSFKGGSTPGEDGMSGIFYQSFWHIVGDTVIEDVRRFFETSSMPPG